MAGVADMTVKIGADITDLISKVDTAKAKIAELGGSTKSVDSVTTSFQRTESEVADTNKEIQKLTASVKQSSIEIVNLTAKNNLLARTNTDLSTQLSDVKSKLSATAAQTQAQGAAAAEATIATSGLSKGMVALSVGMKLLRTVIPTLGISALVSLVAGPLIEAFEGWFKSIFKVSEANKLLKANLENYNDINEEANKNASKQITSLQLLYQAATSVNLSMKERLAAVKGLQDEFPGYFKNINTENILNGNSKIIYDSLTESILKRARADAAVNKLREIGAKQLDLDIQQQKILNATNDEANKAQKLQTQTQQLGLGQTINVDAKALALNAIKTRKDAALKIVAQNKLDLNNQADFIEKLIGLNNLAASVESGIKPAKDIKSPNDDAVKKIAKDGETIGDVLKKLQIQRDFINQKPLLPEEKVKEQVSAIEGAISNLMQKFKLLTDDPHIIKLRADANDLILSQLLKKDSKAVKIEIPAEFKVKPATDISYTDNTTPELIRQNILKELSRRGITKTSPIKIEVPGGFVLTKSMSITGNESKDVLQATLDASDDKMKEMAQTATDILSPAFDSLFTGILTGSQNAFQGFGEALSKAIVQLGVAILKAAAFAAIFSAFGLGGGGSFTSIFKKLLGFSEGGFVKYADGGHIRGAGSGRSDSILARVSNGEYIIPADIVSKFGVGFFDKLRKGMMPSFDKYGLPKFAGGGFISPNIINSQLGPSVSPINIGSGQSIQVYGNFELRNDRLVAAVSRGSAQISRNS